MNKITASTWQVVLILSYLLTTACSNSKAPTLENINEGKQLAFTRSKGNCLACHAIDDGELAGNIAPELKNISLRFKNKRELRNLIWDATLYNPETVMPPFGKNNILSEQEIDKIVDYLWQL